MRRERLLIRQISQGGLTPETVLQGTICLATRDAAVMRDHTGQIVLKDCPPFTEHQRVSLVLPDGCGVKLGSTPTLTLAASGGTESKPLKSQEMKPEEQLSVAKVQQIAEMPHGVEFDVLLNYEKVQSMGTSGVKVHLFDDTGFMGLGIWAAPPSLPERGKMFLSNITKRPPKFKPFAFDLHADLMDGSALLIQPADSDLSVQSNNLRRRDVTVVAEVTAQALFPQGICEDQLVTIVDAVLSNPRTQSFHDKRTNNNKTYRQYEMRVGTNPTILQFTAWDERYFFTEHQLRNNTCTIVAARTGKYMNKLVYSSCAATVFFWRARLVQHMPETRVTVPHRFDERDAAEEEEDETRTPPRSVRRIESEASSQNPVPPTPGWDAKDSEANSSNELEE